MIVLFCRSRPNLTSFEKFQLLIRKQSLYEDDDKVVDTLLHAMVTEEIVHIEQKEGGLFILHLVLLLHIPTIITYQAIYLLLYIIGTQLKLIMDFESNGQAMFKPMR